MQTALEEIVRLNTAPNVAAHFAVTKYSDLTPEEFRSKHLNEQMSPIVRARVQSIKDKPAKNISSAIKVNEFKYEFTDNNDFDRYPAFYKEKLLERNLNFIPLKVDW